MPSRIDMNKNVFKITYEAPWGGVNADADPSDIPFNQFVDMDGIRIKQNVLATTEFNVPLQAQVDFTHPSPNGKYVGITSLRGIIVLFDEAGGILHYDPTDNTVKLIVSSPITEFTTYKAINGFIYISSYPQQEVFQYQPLTFSTGTLTQGSVFVGGKYSAVLNNYLILANTNMVGDDPPAKPGRINWSSPDAYLTFDSTIDRTAGFNVLGDVQDDITGMFLQGNVGYILRTQGVTQFSNTGDPLVPFAFSALWSDDYGVGCNLPDSLSTYGPVAIFSNDTGVYLFQAGSTSDISYGIKRYLQDALNSSLIDSDLNPSYVSGVLHGSDFIDTGSDIKYSMLVFNKLSNTSGINLLAQVFTYNVHDKCWTKQSIDLNNILGSMFPNQPTSINAITIDTYKIFRAPKVEIYNYLLTRSRRISTKYVPYIMITGMFGANPFNIVLQLFDYTNGTIPNVAKLNLVFKEQEFVLLGKPTTTRVLVKAAGTGTLHVTVNDVKFTDIVCNGTRKVYSSSGVCTEEAPQLRITSTNFVGTIIKVLMKGTYADGDIL